MTHFVREYGEVYDALVFLSLYFGELGAAGRENATQNITNPICYSDLKKWVQQGGCDLPDYFRPFCYGSAEDTFLYKIAFEGRPYTHCSYEWLLRSLRNKSFAQRKYVEYFLPGADTLSVQKMIRLEHPSSIELLRQAGLPSDIESCFLYTLIHFDTIIDMFCEIIKLLCVKIAGLHLEFLTQNPTVIETALSMSTEEKLRALSKVTVSTDLSFSLSLLEEQHLSFCPFEQSAFLLGQNFREVLYMNYRYVAVTPFTFAQAIGNQTRYDIYNALVSDSPQSTAELCKRLHLSKNSITYNLNAMLAQGILRLDHVKGLSHYYRIDSEYIQFVAGLLTKSAMKERKR